MERGAGRPEEEKQIIKRIHSQRNREEINLESNEGEEKMNNMVIGCVAAIIILFLLAIALKEDQR